MRHRPALDRAACDRPALDRAACDRAALDPGPCPRPSHLWFAHNFAPFCAACRTLAAWLDTRKARR